MVQTYRAADWDRYKMNVREPHVALEPIEHEIAVVDEALGLLKEAGILPHIRYDQGGFWPFARRWPGSSRSRGQPSRRGCSG